MTARTVAISRALRLVTAVNRARRIAADFAIDVGAVPDGSPESVALALTEKALARHDALHGLIRAPNVDGTGGGK